jgi:hypothetical protein
LKPYLLAGLGMIALLVFGTLFLLVVLDWNDSEDEPLRLEVTILDDYQFHIDVVSSLTAYAEQLPTVTPCDGCNTHLETDIVSSLTAIAKEYLTLTPEVTPSPTDD